MGYESLDLFLVLIRHFGKLNPLPVLFYPDYFSESVDLDR